MNVIGLTIPNKVYYLETNYMLIHISDIRIQYTEATAIVLIIDKATVLVGIAHH